MLSLDNRTVPLMGHIDAVELRADKSWVLVGWAHDPDSPGELLEVEVVEGAEIVAIGRTGEYREDLKRNGLGDGFCGLTVPLPQGLLDDESEHRLHLRLAGTELAITAPIAVRRTDYVGHVDGLEAGVLNGWVLSPAAPGKPLEVDVLVEGTFVERVVADHPRQDVPQYYGNLFCGFRWPVPSQLNDGQRHEVAVRVARTSFVLPEHVSYAHGQADAEPLAASLVEIPPSLRNERRYMAFIDEYFRRSRLAIEAVTADAVVYSGHAAHEFAALLARRFAQAFTAPLDRVLANPVERTGVAAVALYILHTDLAIFIARCLSGGGNRFFLERIRLGQPTILLVEQPDQAGGLESLDLERARLWCQEILRAARSADMIATLETTVIDFFFGHPGFVLSFRPVAGGSRRA